MTGQVCMAIKRIYVPANRRDEFLGNLFTRATDAIVVGASFLHFKHKRPD